MKLTLCVLFAVAVAAVLAKPAIDENIIQAVNSANADWTAAYPEHFKNWSFEGVKKLMGARRGGLKLHQLHTRQPYTEAELKAVPESYDVRDQWASLCPSVSEIRDQANCGSCWAFGASEAMTDRICIASKGGLKVHLSAQDLTSCCTSCGDGCDGGYPYSAWDYWQSTGLVSGGNFGDKSMCFSYQLASCDHHIPQPSPKPPCPDTVPTPACTKKCENGAKWASDKHFGASSYYVQSNEEQIKAEIFNHGSVEAALDVYEDFLTYKNGVYRHVSGEMLGGHAIKITGYGTLGGQKYWTIANSWNEDWGDKGFIKILRGKDECGIESEIVAGLPKL